MVVIYTIVILALGTVRIQAAAAPALSVSITPAHAHVHLAADTSRDNVLVTCVTPANITGCQFKVGERDVIDASRGVNSEQTAGYVFLGDRGRCQVTLPWRTFDLDGSHTVVGCRLRDDVTDWSYADMTVYGSKRRPLSLAVDRPRVIVSPGEAAIFLVSASTPLDTCSLLRDHTWLPVDDVTSCEDRVCYHGAGLAGGECGVTVDNVTDEDNGRLWLRLKDRDFAEGAGLVRLIVTKRPESVSLEFNLTTDKGGTMTLNARCSVIGGRPTPTITWYIAGVKVTEGVVGVAGEEWAWPEDERTVDQSLTRKLNEADVDKELRCTASFMAEGRTLSSARLLSYKTDVSTTSGVLACVLFGLAIFFYALLVSLTDITRFAWRRELFCFKRLSYDGGASSVDTDVVDYHATLPPRVVLREDSESYLEPIQVGQHSRDSYFLPTTTAEDSKRVSTKAERTLGLDHLRRQPLPTPRHVPLPPKKKNTNASTLNKKKMKKSPEDSLFIPTPVDLLEVEQQGGVSSYKPLTSPYADDTPIYGNMFVDAVSEPPLYVNTLKHVPEDDRPVYGNFETGTVVTQRPTVGGGANRPTIEGGANRPTVEGSANHPTMEGGANRPVLLESGEEPVYGNFEVVESVYGNVDTGPMYGNY